jgi:hypothetical protein
LTAWNGCSDKNSKILVKKKQQGRKKLILL